MPLKLVDLQTELIQIILDFLHDSSPHSSRSVLLTNKWLNENVKPILNRRKTLCLLHSIQRSLETHDWTKDPNVVASIRHLTVETTGDWEEGFDRTGYNDFLDRFEPFNFFLSQISNLKSLTWSAGPIPHTLLESLRKHHPRASLKVFKFSRFDCSLDHLDKPELLLSSYPRLTHLGVSGDVIPPFRNHNGSDPSRPRNLGASKAMVARSSSLEYVGLVLPNFVMEQKGFSNPNESGVDASIGRCSSVRSLTLDGPTLTVTRTVLKDLDHYIDTTKLENVKISGGLPGSSYFASTVNMLRNVRHLSLNFGTVRRFVENAKPNPCLQAARSYLLNCVPLQTLSLWTSHDVVALDELLVQHGNTLESLQLHERETLDPWIFNDRAAPYFHRHDTTLADVQSIHQKCPNLLELTIDLTRATHNFDLNNETEMLPILDECAHMNLRRLQIYFDTEGISAFLDPCNLRLQQDNESPSEYRDVFNGQEEHDGDNGQDIIGVAAARDNLTLPSPETFQLVVGTDPAQVMEEYVRSIWKRVFGSKITGERLLDVKFGEWEMKGWPRMYSPIRDPRRFYEARPHERDDRVGDCQIKMKKR